MAVKRVTQPRPKAKKPSVPTSTPKKVPNPSPAPAKKGSAVQDLIAQDANRRKIFRKK